MKMKHLMAVGVTTAMLMGASAASAATITFLNDGTNGTMHNWGNATHGGSTYNPAVNDPFGVSPTQLGANSGQYSTPAGAHANYAKYFNGVNANVGVNSGSASVMSTPDVWAINTDVDTTASFSIDYTLSLINIAGAVLYNNADLAVGHLVATGGTHHPLTASPFDTLGLETITFANTSLLASTTYYLKITGQYVSNANNAGGYTINTPSSESLSTPLPGAVWLFGTGIAGLLGFKRRGSVASTALQA